MKIIDLRSDTVTKPTPAMIEAMYHAEIGDDVYGEDPTVNELQEVAASAVGMEAGLFVASGTMGNLVAVLSHCGRGDEVILGKYSHTFLFEAGGISALGGVHSCQVTNQKDGSLAIDDILIAIRPDDSHHPITRLICLENTHNRCGGTYQPPHYMTKVGELAHENGLAVHLDGARIFNAAIAQGISVDVLTRTMDSVTFCLSKGLCAPVGSVLCGSKLFISKALRIRKMLGGGMRQAGILAAAGIVALETMVSRLVEDHERAKVLAVGLRKIPGLILDADTPATNMVFFSIGHTIKYSRDEFKDRLKERGILIGATGERQFRLVLHYWITDEDVNTVISAFNDSVK